MAPAQRKYKVVGRVLTPDALTALQSLDGWPPYTRYAACSSVTQDTLVAYVEFTRPVRPCVFSAPLITEPLTNVDRTVSKDAVLSLPGTTWEVGSWEDGLVGKHKGTRGLSLQQQVHMAQELLESQRKCMELMERTHRLEAQIQSSAVTGSSAGSSTTVYDSSSTTNNTTNNITNNNTNNTHNTIIINNFGEENADYIPRDVLRRRLLAKTKGIVETIKDLHMHDEHPENHNIYLLSSRRDVFEVFKDGVWEPKAGTALIDDLLFRGYRLNFTANAAIDWESMLPVVEESFRQWTQDMHAVRLGRCKKQHVAQARRQVHAMLSTRRRGDPQDAIVASSTADASSEPAAA